MCQSVRGAPLAYSQVFMSSMPQSMSPTGDEWALTTAQWLLTL